LVRVNAKTGEPASPGDSDVIFEAFKPGSEPGSQGEIIGGLGSAIEGPATGTGGLY
jgi:penicillin-binding protein 1A